MALFIAENIEKNYSEHKALENVSIHVPENSIFGLLGPNGAGKTTLIRIINQITAPDKGKLYFDSEPLSPKHITQIGYLPEERGLYKKMKVGEQAMYLAQLKGLSKQEARKRLDSWFEKFEIQNWWNKKVEELSKGMQQKVQFIVTVLHEPKLLIFDEPFSGFDPINANILKEEILNFQKKGATIIFSTHNMSSVEELCSEIVLINKSKVILSGNVKNIRSSHKKNLFEVICNNSEHVLELPEDICLESEIKEQSETRFLLRTSQNFSSNDLLQQLLPQREIISFREILPNMNEIFIETVLKNQKQIIP